MMKDGKILYHGTMDQMKERFTKLQVVFEESRSEIFKELSGVITYSNLGSVYTVILEGYGEPIHEALKTSRSDCSRGNSIKFRRSIRLQQPLRGGTWR